MLDKLGSSLKDVMTKLATLGRIDKDTIESIVRDIQRALLSSDVNVKLVMELSNRIRDRSLKEKTPPGMSAREHVLRVVYQELTGIVGKSAPVELRKQTIMMVGLYGTGKTTSSAKLAKYFQRKGLRPAVICADVYRPAAYDQLKQLCDSINIPFYGERDNTDALKIVKAGMKNFGGYDVVIIDTAGRHALDAELVKEMKRINESVKPEHRFLVIDAALGQIAREHAKAFNDAVGITGVIITKLDGTAKGGGALSAVAETGAGVAFIGTGETVDDFEKFEPDGFISRLLGMGDIKALVEKAEEAMLDEEIDVKSIMKGKFTLNDLYAQLQALNKLGPLKSVLSMLPLGGMGVDVTEEQYQVTKNKLEHFKVIMDSMTPEEKENPKIVSGSRVSRIARGSGTSAEEVKELLKYHKMMQEALKKFMGRKFPAKKMMKMFG
jgi:signal recognition particle subunit SRP54